MQGVYLNRVICSDHVIRPTRPIMCSHFFMHCVKNNVTLFEYVKYNKI